MLLFCSSLSIAETRGRQSTSQGDLLRVKTSKSCQARSQDPPKHVSFLPEIMADMHFVPLSAYNWSLGNFDFLQWNPTVYCLVASFFAVSLWLALELSVQVFYTFKRHRGLYFWSILIVACGIALHTIGLLLKLLVPGVNAIFATVLAKLGWIMDTTGFAVVLYSRLHLVVQNRRTLHLVLAMIVVDAVLFHTPMIVFLMGLSIHKDWDPYVTPFEYTQVVGFSIQETVISGIYIRKTAKFLKSGYSTQMRKVMTMLIAVQVLVVLMDIALLVIDCIGMFTLKAVLHPFAYGVKLKIEFAVLNLLLNLVKHGSIAGDFFGAPNGDGSDEGSANTLPGRRSSAPRVWFRRASMGLKEPDPKPDKVNITKTLEFEVTWQAPTCKNSHAMILPLRSPSPAAAPEMVRLDSGSTLQGVSSDRDGDNSLEDVERQYLGSFGFHRRL